MKKAKILYGALFQSDEIDALFTQIDALDSVYEKGSSPVWYYEARDRLCKIDKRFDYELKEYPEFKYTLFIYGIDPLHMKDDETFGAFKKIVEDGIKEVFKKAIPCEFHTLIEEDY